MTIRLNVCRGSQVVTPIRFTRAVNGAPRRDSPDPDDRGFAMGNRPAGWGSTDARGAMVGITLGDTVRLRVLREDIENGAQLFVTSTEPAVLRITSPAAGTALPANGIFEMEALQNVARAAKVQVRFGAVDGPVLGEMEPHIFPLRRLWVRFHRVTISGVAPTRTAASLPALLTAVNDIWRPTGIQFRLRDIVNDVVPAPPFATPGTVTTDLTGVAGPWQVTEYSRVLQLNPHANSINVYCVHAMTDPGSGWLGLTWDNDVARPDGYGIAITDACDATSVAHEFGHMLNIDEHVDDLGGGNTRSDMWSFRRLMVGGWPPAAPAHRNNVGYGAGAYGAVISLKNFARDPRDGEHTIAARRARNPY